MSDQAKLSEALDAVAAGRMIPYLGPGVSGLSPDVPASPDALCAHLEAEVRVPKRASGNLWSAAQYVESRKFRATLNDIIERAFAPGLGQPNAVQRAIATMRPAMIVDTWYDDGLLAAMQCQADWGWVQGVSRNGEWIEIWTRAYDTTGAERPEGPDTGWDTLVYKPHGMARKGSSFLMSDSDYVEVLTEIDIQTPIPEEVRARRTGRGFLFLGCRFDDQMLRTFARQITKRSGGGHVAVIDGALTRMEGKFLDEMGITRLDLPPEEVTAALSAPV
ncbi:SIR2 family NAD-dependent protein deacylase [Tropicimonas isoalkanivorans]|uniref:SIR2-like domain-containing protein n=1 Tax=Tropicimonas isoalkanivorans TaxID=441112 RepID=A0A1I1H5D0_9RHOB|nr:SIR2 family protein [Tropicimonas isoalkanivorans]SFC18976.1 SIR2-like domain-containing protein [Tropicimonas isoalkanivorans]